jgi:hypothetical protein
MRDQELIRQIRAIRRREEWLVVSSDRAVVGEAQARGIRVMSSQEFAHRLQMLDQPRVNAPDKRGDRPLSKAEIEEWLHFFGVDEDEDTLYY